MQPLAIVIPAFKARFLDDTLRSIAAQTCRDFVVYVGDDASPDDLGAICARWRDAFDLRYTRFASNLGASNLVEQWRRSVNLSLEPWVWMFSDDDTMPANAVARLLAAIAQEGERFDLFHFNVERLDAQGRKVTVEPPCPPFPPLLPVREFALRRFSFGLASYAPDYAFARTAFERHGGFVSFPRAWCSDDATWIRLGTGSGIRTLSGAPVGWRHSGENVSSQRQDLAAKMRAQTQFLQWLDGFLLSHPAASGEPSDAELLAQAQCWFFQQAKIARFRFGPRLGLEVVLGLGRVRGFCKRKLWLSVLRSDARRWVIDTRIALRGH